MAPALTHSFMLLSLHEFIAKSIDISLFAGGEIGFDFETDGLRPFSGSRAFLLGFTDTQGEKFSVKLDRSWELHSSLRVFFGNPNIKYCAHNAKFELAFLDAQFGIAISGEVWDTEVHARIEKNNYLTYSLQACAERVKLSKYKPMLDWLKARSNKKAYHLAPDELIIPYCEQDAWLSWQLRRYQVETFQDWDRTEVPVRRAVRLENAVLRPLFEMEKVGLLVDIGYCKRAAEYEKEQVFSADREFRQLSGVDLVESRKTLEPIFNSHGIHYGTTALGNPSFTEDHLTCNKEHPIVRAILKKRRALKRLKSYWENFLEIEHNGIVHPSIHQNKAQTGRMSISDPSCQNWSTDEEEGTLFPIRRAFLARPGCRIASLDYSQMELRKASDEAEDEPMIERILSGADLHQEVANMAGVSRSLAKNGRFAKQYGAGISKIASTLGVSEGVARTISDAVDEQAKKTALYSAGLAITAKHSFGYTWTGRRFYFDPGFHYKAFNYCIQGGCAEILKYAICLIDRFLRKSASKETYMLVPIHDEIFFNLAESDLHLLPDIKHLMIAAHLDKKTLPMDVSIEVGPNFHDLIKWVP